MLGNKITNIFEIELEPYPDIFHIGRVSTVDALKGMEEDGITEIEIYYAEEITDKTEWSIDVMSDYINDACGLSWVWTVTSKSEYDLYTDIYKNDIIDDYEIIVDAEFSDEVVCNAITEWLRNHNINKINPKMIDLKDAEGSGYIAGIRAELKENAELYTEQSCHQK